MKLKSFISIILVLIATSRVLAGAGDPDTSFAGTGKLRFGFNSGDDVANGTVTQPDGKLVVVGSAPNGIGDDFLILRYNADGSLDTSFGTGGQVLVGIGDGSDVATSAALQSDGKIVVAGWTQAGGTSEDFALVRLNSNGTLDTTFNVTGKQVTALSNFPDGANAVAIQPDGKIVLAGYSYINGSSPDYAIARYNTNGSLDTGFGISGKNTTDATMASQHDKATGLAILPDGKIFVVGHGGGNNYFVRYTSSGHTDSSWGLLGNGIMPQRYGNSDASNAVTLQPDGKIIVAGVSDGNFLIVRLQSNGLDLSFGTNGRKTIPMGAGHDEASAVMVTAAQKIIVAGYSTGSDEDFAVAQVDFRGDLDTTFNGTGKLIRAVRSGNDRAQAIALQAGGVVAAGYSGLTNKDFTVVRFTPTGEYDSTFDLDGRRFENIGLRASALLGTVIQPDGKIIAVGYTESDTSGVDFAVARFNANGTLDASFDGDGKVNTDFSGTSSDEAWAVALQPDGKIVVAGKTHDNGTSDFAVARYNSNGSLDTSFNGTGKLTIPVGSADDHGSGVAIQSDGKIVISGNVFLSQTTRDIGVVRLTSSGSLDSTFVNGGKTIIPVGLGDDQANSMKIQPDGKILIAGSSSNGTNMDFSVIRLTTGGLLDNSFGSFGRQITSVGAGDDQSFGLALQPDGKVLVSGYAINSATSGDLVVVRYTAAGQPDNTFDNDGIFKTLIGLSVAAATGVGVQSDGKIVATGVAVIGTQLDFAGLRLNTNGTLDDSYGIGGKTIADISGAHDFGRAMALDANGRAVVVGDSNGLAGIVRFSGDFTPRKAPFDLDGDGKTDISIFRPAGGEWWVSKSSGGTFALQFGASTDKIAPADYTGDGKADVAFFRPSTGQWFILRSEDSSFYGFVFGMNGDVPASADYDGDGKADPAVFRPSNGTWYIQKSSGGFTITQFGVNGDQPVAADYDGDGKADVAIRRPSDGSWWINRSASGVIAFVFGTGSDKTVPGDYTGDGKADVAVWRPSTGQWFILRSEDSSFYGFPFGSTGDVVAPGDYDGDGKYDPTVFRPSNGTWYSGRTSAGTLIVQFGLNGDQPLPGAYVR